MQKITSLFILGLTLATQSWGVQQVFELDTSKIAQDDVGFIKDMCAESYKLDSTEDLANLILKSETDLGSKNIPIEKTAHSVIIPGGYSGPALTRAFLLTRKLDESNPMGVRLLVTIDQFGIAGNRVGFTVSTELLNYRGSAELQELNVCRNLSYNLIKSEKPVSKN